MAVKHPNLYSRYVAPAEFYAPKTDKKMDVFRGVVINNSHYDTTVLRLVAFSLKPFEWKE